MQIIVVNLIVRLVVSLLVRIVIRVVVIELIDIIQPINFKQLSTFQLIAFVVFKLIIQTMI